MAEENLTPTPEAPAPAPVEAPVAAPIAPAAAPDRIEPAEPKSRREMLSAALKADQDRTSDKPLRDKMIEAGVIKPADGTQPRAPDGKFAPKAADQKPAAAPATQVTSAAPQGAPSVPAPARVPMPKAFKQEHAPLWEKTDPAFAEIVAKYVQDASAGIEKYKGAATQAEAILKEVQPFEGIIRAEGGTAQTAIRDLLQTSYVLRTGSPQQKATLTAQMITRFGIPPEMIAQALQNPQPQQTVDPRYEALEQKFNTLSQQLNGQQERHYTSIADSFGKDRAHWDLLKPHVAHILANEPIEGSETMTEQQILEAAYTKALKAYPVITQAEAEAKRQAALDEERKRANAAATASKAAAVQVTGAPGGGAPAAFNPKDRASVIRHAMRVHSR